MVTAVAPRSYNQLVITSIKIGFNSVTRERNYADCHRALFPFGMNWGRGLLIRGEDYLDAIIGPYGTSHSRLKQELSKGESTAGSFYFGYNQSDKGLYFEYASDRMFQFDDPLVLDSIMEALKNSNGPFRDFELENSGKPLLHVSNEKGN